MSSPNTSSTDSIRKQITLRASRSRVWRALTDSSEFGQWFGVAFEGPFRVGEKISGQITHKECDHMIFDAWIDRMDAEDTFVFRWQPQDISEGVDKSSQPSTVVTFVLADADDGTLLTVTESGFDALPESSRMEVFSRNEGGWTAQMDNIRKHVDA